jgi:D-serine deaminase-like pyridoxal phosphate-dependent protein
MTAFDSLDPKDWPIPSEIEERLVTPALVVWLDHVRHNIQCVLERVGGPDRWRPHVKTTKTPAIWAKLVGAGIRQFKCATTREAEHLARVLLESHIQGGQILIAYPLAGANLARAATLADTFRQSRFDVLVEDPESATSAPEILGLFVDVNTGMNRTGIPWDDEERLLATARAAGSRLRGLHLYDGHQLHPDPAERKRNIHTDHERVLGLLDRVRQAVGPLPELVTSGTPAFTAAIDFAPFADLGDTRHRVSPGTVIFHDGRSEEQDLRLGLRPAAQLVARVSSHPRADRFTCDAGSKSIAAEAGSPCAIALGLPGWQAKGPSEEHLPFDRVSDSASLLPARGRLIQLIPRHVCPTVNLAEKLVLVDRGAFVGTASVAARAHDLGV